MADDAFEAVVAATTRRSGGSAAGDDARATPTTCPRRRFCAFRASARCRRAPTRAWLFAIATNPAGITSGARPAAPPTRWPRASRRRLRAARRTGAQVNEAQARRGGNRDAAGEAATGVHRGRCTSSSTPTSGASSARRQRPRPCLPGAPQGPERPRRSPVAADGVASMSEPCPPCDRARSAHRRRREAAAAGASGAPRETVRLAASRGIARSRAWSARSGARRSRARMPRCRARSSPRVWPTSGAAWSASRSFRHRSARC